MRLIDIKPLQKEHWHLHRYVSGVYYARVEEMELEKVPTVDAAPVKHGRWINMKNGNADCSACGRNIKGVYDDDNADRFCRSCGAKMDLEEQGADNI